MLHRNDLSRIPPSPFSWQMEAFKAASEANDRHSEHYAGKRLVEYCRRLASGLIGKKSGCVR